MDLELSADQVALREAVRDVCTDRFDLDTLRALEGRGFAADRWSDLADLGVFGARLPEDAGGTGLGSADAVLVFEELGRGLVPGPVLWTHLGAGLVDGAADGTTVVGGVDLGAAGAPVLVEHLADVDVVLGIGGDRLLRWDAAALDAEVVPSALDPLTPVHHVRVLPDAEEIGDAGAAARLLAEATVFTAAFAVGLADAVTAMAAAYALDREQFGRPIGSFQAVKHLLADMVVRTEVARSAAYAAGALLDDPGTPGLERAVHAAKLTADTAADKNARACIQVHGGMGYTWEVPAHYYLKRAWVLETQFGGPAAHADAVAALVGGDATYVRAGELLARALAAAGVGRVVGDALPGLPVLRVADPQVALLLAAADARLTGGLGAAVADGHLVLLADAGVAVPAPVGVDAADGLAEAVAVAAATVRVDPTAGAALRIDLDLDAPVDAAAGAAPAPAPATWEPAGEAVVDRIQAAGAPVLLVGPGVVRAGVGAVADLRAVAAAACIGVLNTWGAKGVFDWRSRHHLATAGLQADDFVLSGLPDADLVVAVGVDPAEAPDAAWRIAPADLVVAPEALGPLAERWRREDRAIAPVPLRARLGALVTDWWASTAPVAPPARRVADLAEVLGAHGVVAADPGAAGLWVARTYATVRPGSVHVPGRAGTEGFAAACLALAARLRDPLRPALAVVDAVGVRTAAVLDTARRLDVGVVVEEWSDAAPPATPATQRGRLAEALAAGTTRVCAVPVDASCREALVAVAGPVVVWRPPA